MRVLKRQLLLRACSRELTGDRELHLPAWTPAGPCRTGAREPASPRGTRPAPAGAAAARLAAAAASAVAARRRCCRSGSGCCCSCRRRWMSAAGPATAAASAHGAAAAPGQSGPAAASSRLHMRPVFVGSIMQQTVEATSRLALRPGLRVLRRNVAEASRHFFAFHYPHKRARHAPAKGSGTWCDMRRPATWAVTSSSAPAGRDCCRGSESGRGKRSCSAQHSHDKGLQRLTSRPLLPQVWAMHA